MNGTPSLLADRPAALAAVADATPTRRGGSLIGAMLLLVLLAFPALATALDESFYIGFASRVMILALAASSLNLILGFGGMVSFGHAAFFGGGAYVVGMLSAEISHEIGLLPGTQSAWIAWPAAMLISGGLAALIGAISLRTRGVSFIMITLAFAQMIYYLFVSMKTYGGDEGMNLDGRSHIGFGLDLADDTTFYYVVLALLAASMFVMQRLVQSRFGAVIGGIRENETRMEAVGYNTYLYKLVCFVIAGVLAGLAGALIANQNTFVSPRMLDWHQSGLLMMMVILGGVGRQWGGVIGAVAILLFEEILSGYTQYWQFWLGLLLLALVIVAPKGLAGLTDRFISHGGAR